MVVAAHPDDEILGCGGTIARHIASGDFVHVIFLTNGVGARGETDTEAGERQSAAWQALQILGVQNASFNDFPDNQLDTVPLIEVVRFVEEVAASFLPKIVYTHNSNDLNIDHRICHNATKTAFRPIPGQSAKAVYAFEVLSSTEWAFGTGQSFTPSLFVDISDYLTLKRQALAAYAEEMRVFPHARSFEAVDALARCRGATVGIEAAEACEVIREVR
jgi:LmbE family N-acetylglucosaminyl deacetylase